jgi:hypothetical protein
VVVVVSGEVLMLPGCAVNHAPFAPHCPPTSRQAENLVPLTPVHESEAGLPLWTEVGTAAKARVVGMTGGGAAATTVALRQGYP